MLSFKITLTEYNDELFSSVTNPKILVCAYEETF